MWISYIPLTRNVLPLLYAPHVLVNVVPSFDTRIAHKSRSPSSSLLTASSATASACYMLVHIFACDGKTKREPTKILLHGILEDFAKIKCPENKYSYGPLRALVTLQVCKCLCCSPACGRLLE